MRRVRVVADGLVQGVFFRATLQEEARRLGISGWARNTPDGKVEAELQGREDAVEQALRFCRSDPGHSSVESLGVTELEPVDGENGFRVR